MQKKSIKLSWVELKADKTGGLTRGVKPTFFRLSCITLGLWLLMNGCTIKTLNLIVQEFYLTNRLEIEQVLSQIRNTDCKEFHGFVFDGRILETQNEFQLILKDSLSSKTYPESCIGFNIENEDPVILREITHLHKNESFGSLNMTISRKNSEVESILIELLDFYDEPILEREVVVDFQSEIYSGKDTIEYKYWPINDSDYYYRVKVN